MTRVPTSGGSSLRSAGFATGLVSLGERFLAAVRAVAVERCHCSITKQVRPMVGFKSFISAFAITDSIEAARIVRECQLTPGHSATDLFAALTN